MFSTSGWSSFPSPESLLERDRLLSEEARQLPGGSYQRRSEIEHEIVKMRRMLKRLGHDRLARLREREVVLEAIAHHLPPGSRRDDVLREIEEVRSVIKSLKPGNSASLQFSLPNPFSVIRGQTMHTTEPRIIRAVAATFYKLMRQIYLEQVWRQNEPSGTNPAGDRKEDLATSHPGVAEARSLRTS
jgi:hypothetical protein